MSRVILIDSLSAEVSEFNSVEDFVNFDIMDVYFLVKIWSTFFILNCKINSLFTIDPKFVLYKMNAIIASYSLSLAKRSAAILFPGSMDKVNARFVLI